MVMDAECLPPATCLPPKSRRRHYPRVGFDQQRRQQICQKGIPLNRLPPFSAEGAGDMFGLRISFV